RALNGCVRLAIRRSGVVERPSGGSLRLTWRRLRTPMVRSTTMPDLRRMDVTCAQALTQVHTTPSRETLRVSLVWGRCIAPVRGERLAVPACPPYALSAIG